MLLMLLVVLCKGRVQAAACHATRTCSWVQVYCFCVCAESGVATLRSTHTATAARQLVH